MATLQGRHCSHRHGKRWDGTRSIRDLHGQCWSEVVRRVGIVLAITAVIPAAPALRRAPTASFSEPYVTDHGSTHAQCCDRADGHCGVSGARQLICQSGEETTARRDGTRAIGSDGSMSMGSPTRPIGAAAEPEFYCWVFPLSKQMNSKVNPNNKHR